MAIEQAPPPSPNADDAQTAATPRPAGRRERRRRHLAQDHHAARPVRRLPPDDRGARADRRGARGRGPRREAPDRRPPALRDRPPRNRRGRRRHSRQRGRRPLAHDEPPAPDRRRARGDRVAPGPVTRAEVAVPVHAHHRRRALVPRRRDPLGARHDLRGARARLPRPHPPDGHRPVHGRPAPVRALLQRRAAPAHGVRVRGDGRRVGGGRLGRRRLEGRGAGRTSSWRCSPATAGWSPAGTARSATTAPRR